MMNLDGARKYHARMQRVLDYIDAHIDEDLSVDVLAEVAAFSPRHFHRQFSALFGVNVYRYVQLTRLRRASYRLAFREDEPVTRIALDSGYEGPEAFSRAFRRSAGQTPSAFREQPDWSSWRETYGSINDARRTIMTIGFTDDQVKIVDFPETQIAILRHRGDPAAIGDSIRRFIAWRKQTGLSPRTSRTFGILHHDPETTAPDDYRQDLCAATTQIIAPNAQGVIAGSIPAGRCASLRLIGPSDNLRFAARFLYADWLPRSQEELRDFPVFIQRVSFFPDVAEKDAITDIFLPLK